MEKETKTERERERERERETETKMERETESEMKTQTERETETEIGRAGLTQLPRLIALKLNNFVYYKEDGSVMNGEASVMSPWVKIEVEIAKSNSTYVHLRFSHSNRYWQLSQQDDSIVALSTEPQEDISKRSCTLFTPFPRGVTNGTIQLTHVQSGRSIVPSTGPLSLSPMIVPIGPFLPFPPFQPWPPLPVAVFEVTDWGSLVSLPPRIAFKGYNDKYLKAVTQDRWYPYHKFESDDPNEQTSGYEVHQTSDGHVRIKSDHWGRFWRRSPNWIWGDSDDTTGANRDTLFWPVQIDESTIALRNAGNNNFCIALTTEGKVDCLNAGSSTITNRARLVVEELVLDRTIFNINYHLESSRIFDETPYLAGSSSVANNSDSEASMSVEIEYTNEVSNTYSNSISITAGVTTTIEGGLPLILSGSISVSYEGSYTREWGQTTTTSQTIKAQGSVAVPPRTVALVNFIGTRGTCNVPFSYTQRDRSSTNGRITETNKVDGIFQGVNSYNFQFVVQSLRSL